MSEKNKQEIYFRKRDLLLNRGIKEGSIVAFDEELYEKMSHTFISAIPLSICIKHFKAISGLGMCFDKTLFLFFCFDNATLVHASTKDLLLRFGEEHNKHQWIEIGDEVYDTTLELKFKKNIYYEIYKPYDISKTTMQEYKNRNEESKKLYEMTKNTTLSDFQPNGKRRRELCFIASLLEAYANISNNEAFQKDVSYYFHSVQYYQEQAEKEINVVIQKRKEFQ